MLKCIILNDQDNVATAVADLEQGDIIEAQKPNKDTFQIEIKEKIPFGHKIAIKDINNNCDITKYGEVIGKANQDIKFGELVHTENLESQRGRGDL